MAIEPASLTDVCCWMDWAFLSCISSYQRSPPLHRWNYTVYDGVCLAHFSHTFVAQRLKWYLILFLLHWFRLPWLGDSWWGGGALIVGPQTCFTYISFPLHWAITGQTLSPHKFMLHGCMKESAAWWRIMCFSARNCTTSEALLHVLVLVVVIGLGAAFVHLGHFAMLPAASIIRVPCLLFCCLPEYVEGTDLYLQKQSMWS